MYFCAIFILPFRIIAIVSSLSFLVVILKILAGGDDYQQTTELATWRKNIIKYTARYSSRLILLASGIYNVEMIHATVKDYESNHRIPDGVDASIPAPIIVSNHITLLDAIYHTSSRHQPSFLAKKEVMKIPLIGTITRGFQSIFVNRDSRENKNEALTGLRLRGKLIAEGKKLPPIVIFPEGTSTNGDYLISFKKGAFEPLLPVKIVCLEYPARHMNISFDSVPTSISFILSLC